MIKIIQKNKDQIATYSIAEFERIMGIKWVTSLEFETLKISNHVSKYCLRGLKREKIDRQQKWLGIYFSKEIERGIAPELIIAWRNSVCEYGVIADKPIAKGTFIGEYTGVVRKRRREDQKNNYCFEYNLGETFWKSPYVIDARDRGNYTRFINHSDRPNLEPVSVYYKNAMHVILIAQEMIPVGEELTYHYGHQYWRKRSPPSH